MSVAPRQFALDETKVKEKMIDFDRTTMEDEQNEIANEMSRFLSNHIGISHNVIRMFISLAISMWQGKEKKLLKDINDQSPDIRFQHVKAISIHFENLIIPILQNKVEGPDFKKALEGTLKLYKDTWANR